MVARSDDGGECPHQPHPCEVCEFRRRLAAHIERGAGGGERSWLLGSGRLIESLLWAAARLHDARRERFTDETVESAVEDAADALVSLWGELESLREQLSRE